jgi:hypothetical protein
MHVGEKAEKSDNGAVRTYLLGLFEYDQKQDAVEQKVRIGAKWIFDYMRNLMTIGALLFLGKVAHNPTLTNLGLVLNGILWAYAMSYWEPLSILPFHPLKNKKRANQFNIAFFFVVLIPLALAIQIGLINVANQVADAYLYR